MGIFDIPGTKNQNGVLFENALAHFALQKIQVLLYRHSNITRSSLLSCFGEFVCGRIFVPPKVNVPVASALLRQYRSIRAMGDKNVPSLLHDWNSKISLQDVTTYLRVFIIH